MQSVVKIDPNRTPIAFQLRDLGLSFRVSRAPAQNGQGSPDGGRLKAKLTITDDLPGLRDSIPAEISILPRNPAGDPSPKSSRGISFSCHRDPGESPDPPDHPGEPSIGGSLPNESPSIPRIISDPLRGWADRLTIFRGFQDQSAFYGAFSSGQGPFSFQARLRSFIDSQA